MPVGTPVEPVGGCVDAFDADVLIYASQPDNRLGEPIRALFAAAENPADPEPAGIGSVLLLPELLSKPWRDQDGDQVASLSEYLDRLELFPVDHDIAYFAAELGARYGLRAADATHLATAIVGGADRFITNNSKDFTDGITGIAIVGPQHLEGTR